MKQLNASNETYRTLVDNFNAVHLALKPGGKYESSALGKPPGLPEIDEKTAYALQTEVNAELRQTYGLTASGYKISMTAPEDRVPVNAEGPTSGVLYSHQLLASNVELHLEQLNNVLLEPELVFRNPVAITDIKNHDRLLAALEVAAGIEVPMSRVPEWFPPGQPPNIDLGTFIADNSAAGFVVVGDVWKPAATMDVAAVTVRLTEPDESVLRGTSNRVMGSPLSALRWLYARIIQAEGQVPAGTVVSSGTLLSPRRPAAGTFEAAFSDGLGTVKVTFR